MADAMTLAPVEAKESAQAEEALIAAQDLPLERRMDVTVDELETLPLPHPAELYNGKVVFKMPTFAHGVIQANIGKKIGIYLESNPVGLLSGDANYRLWPERTKESRAPDLSFILKERLPADLYRYLPLAPDLAIEILSPDDRFMQVMDKVDEYLSQGVKMVWVVIASTREVLVCTSQSKHIVRDKLDAPELLPNFELPVQDIFVGL
jgi:Uma2 family endonuclease